MPYGRSNKKISETHMMKKSGFKMRSGNAPPFKQMGAMGARAVPIEDPLLRQGQRGITGVSDFSAMQDPAFIKSPMKQNDGSYETAKKNDPNLDKYIAERKLYKAGSAEYEALQAKINAAYGKNRSETLKTAQVKKHATDTSRKAGTPKVEETKSEDVDIKKTEPKFKTKTKTQKVFGKDRKVTKIYDPITGKKVGKKVYDSTAHNLVKEKTISRDDDYVYKTKTKWDKDIGDDVTTTKVRKKGGTGIGMRIKQEIAAGKTRRKERKENKQIENPKKDKTSKPMFS